MVTNQHRQTNSSLSVWMYEWWNYLIILKRICFFTQLWGIMEQQRKIGQRVHRNKMRFKGYMANLERCVWCWRVGDNSNHSFHAIRSIDQPRQSHLGKEVRRERVATPMLHATPWRGRQWLITAVSWYSFCQPQKDDRLSQPTLCYFNSMTGAQTQDPKMFNQSIILTIRSC